MFRARKKSDKKNQPRDLPGPGELLRRARTEQHKPMREVARVLNLPQEHIEALENDNYHFVSRDTYLRGYILGYAKLVNLPERDITAALEHALSAAHAKAEEESEEEEGGTFTFAKFAVRLSLPALVLLLFSLLVTWWFFHEGDVQENYMRQLSAQVQ